MSYAYRRWRMRIGSGWHFSGYRSNDRRSGYESLRETMAKAGTSFAKKLTLGAGAALLAAAIPSSVFAVGMLSDGGTFSERSSFAAFTPASGDPRLARIVAERSGGKTRMVRFTPAGANTPASDRSITVAVRVDRQDAQAISSRSSVDSARENTSTDSRLRIASNSVQSGSGARLRKFCPSLQSSFTGRDCASSFAQPLASCHPRSFGI